MPLQPTLTLRTTAHENSQGRRYLSYTPVFTPDCTARGSLFFATWQVWEDEPHTHAAAQAKALANARTVLRLFAAAL